MGFVSGTYTMRIPAGETLLMPYVSATLYLLANTSSVTVQATFCEV
jgi:hypothetical protein